MSDPSERERSPFSLRRPGDWIDLPDKTTAWNAERSLDHLHESFRRVAVAWALFEECDTHTQATDPPALARWLPRGRVPNGLRLHAQFIYAEAFLYAADMVGRRLRTLAAEHESTKSALTRFSEAFPTLSELRHSTAHADDRQRGLGKYKQPLQPKGRDSQGNLVPIPLVISGSFFGRNYSATLANGELGQIEVSRASVEQIRDCVEEAFRAFPWIGLPSESF